MKSSLLLAVSLVFSFNLAAKDYYFSATGKDKHSGHSAEQAWRNLEKLKQVQLRPGDNIYLQAGASFTGQIAIDKVRGTVQRPIQITTYSDHKGAVQFKQGMAHIDAGKNLAALKISDSSFIKVSNLELSAIEPLANKLSGKTEKKAMRLGVLVKANTPGTYQSISLDNLLVRDVFYYSKQVKRSSDEVKSANGTQNYGWGIRVINNLALASFKDIRISNSKVENVAHTGIKFTSRHRRIFDVEVAGNQVSRTGGPGIQLSGVIGGVFTENKVNRSGSNDDPRKWGRGSGLWTWGSEQIVIEKSHFTNANGPGDSAGVHIDYNCRDVVVQHNYSANNAGGFYEVLGNNFNTVYRYNISYNDGHRVKGKNGAFQQGKTFWLSGYNGNKKRSGPYNSYFYNNTIYVDESIVSNVAIDRATSGALVANNIFHVIGDAGYVLGDQYKPEKGGKSKIKNFVFANNVFLHQGSWPDVAPVKDNAPIIGDAGFNLSKMPKIEQFIPLNKALLKDKGTFISAIKGDSQGIFNGMAPAFDFFGNPIVGKPDIGAVELDD